MNQEFIPLTEDQLIAAEKGDIKLKFRNGAKVLQFTWSRPPYTQDSGSVLSSITESGVRSYHYKDGRYSDEIGGEKDLFIDEEETAKIKQPTEPTPQQKHKCSYKGQLAGVPDKVVHLMLKRQVEQGNKEDVSVFEYIEQRGKAGGGMDWSETQEGHEYWDKVINGGNYDLVPDEPEPRIYEVGEIIEIEECGFWVIAEHRDTKNGIVVVWLNGGYHQITDGLHRKKQNNRTVTIDGKVMTVKEALKYISSAE